MLLNGWKEIANYLRSGLRTTQRWESKGLPVIRPNKAGRGHVVAYTEHLDRWVKRSGPHPENFSNYEAEIERSQELLLNLSKQRIQIRRRMDELRQHLASLRANHRKHE